MGEWHIAPSVPPKARPMNYERVSVEHPFQNQRGVVVDMQGVLQALWMNIDISNDERAAMGLPALYILPALYQVQQAIRTVIVMLSVLTRSRAKLQTTIGCNGSMPS
jgi:hypothetical protein